MPLFNLRSKFERVLIVGPIYDHLETLQITPEYLVNYDLVVFNGNLCYPPDLEAIRQSINYMSNLLNNKILYNLGNYDLQLMNQIQDNIEYKDIFQWLKSKSNIINFSVGQNKILIISGGVDNKMTKDQLTNNIEASFISQINQKSWHLQYGGGLGYVISNNPLTQQPPQFHNFSAQIGNTYQSGYITYALEITSNGVGKVFPLNNINKQV
jgi:predicted phosphodiesterase